MQIVDTTDEVKQLVAEQLKLETNLVSDSEYEDRLKICKDCPSLSSDITCMHCGCYIHFRTRLKDKSCPHPSGAKW
ncbi:DUF6171 family protein [Sediminibacillus dalangtanensis]|uniref:DUF6171 family protein n=1 Tax=Sediminibacillus dalangtanensis TaxID=2729421 RepID=UPI001FD7E0F6|nr:DUF6171 family protein [Sediminibacillus dalangtanensis]